MLLLLAMMVMVVMIEVDAAVGRLEPVVVL